MLKSPLTSVLKQTDNEVAHSIEKRNEMEMQIFFCSKNKIKTNFSYLFNNHILNRSDIKALKLSLLSK